MIDALSRGIDAVQASRYKAPEGKTVWQLPNGDFAFSSGPLKKQGGAAGAGAAAPLGIKRQFVDIADAKGGPNPAKASEGHKEKQLTPAQQAEKKKLQLREQWADQREAAKIMWRHSPDGKPKGVTLCGWTLQAQRGAVDVVRVTKGEAAPRAYFQGLTKCKLGWVCPVCTKEKAEKARQKVNALLSRGRRDGWRMVMVTLTAQHDADMDLAWLWKRISAASDELRKAHTWKRVVNPQLEGSAKAVEFTHGRNGWHPHYHVILIFKSGITEEAAMLEAEKLRGSWMDQLEAVGLTGNQAAFNVQGAAVAGNYLAKWGTGEELTLGHAKQGRKGQRTPWQLLRDSRDGDFEAGELWHEFVTVVKGTHQLRITPGLRVKADEELARLEAQRDQAIADGKLKDEPEHEVSLCQISEEEWKLRGRHRRILIREAAEAGTRKDAEREVWTARNADKTDRDLLDVRLIEDDEVEKSGFSEAHDEPETRLAAFKKRRRGSWASLFDHLPPISENNAFKHVDSRNLELSSGPP